MNTSMSLKGDIPVGNWIDRWMPAAVRPYLRLMRLDRPIGTWLLLLPCWWGQALASDSWPDWKLFLLFGIGAVVMRGAGCTINDIADADFDGKVARTAARPIPSGAVSRKQAALFLVLQLLVGLAVLMQLDRAAILTGAASLFLIFTYPFMKRITYWPQAWLGLAFNWGALVSWAAVQGEIGLPALLLYAAGWFWTLGYDTIYAHQDKEDDQLIGVKSTALRLGANTGRALVLFYGMTIGLLGGAGLAAGENWPFFAMLLPALAHLGWQIRRLEIDNSPRCLALFRANRDFGWIVLAAILLGKIPV